MEVRKLRSYGLDLTVDQVRLEGEYPDTFIAVIMWADQLPVCRVGWRRPLWDAGMFADWGPEPEQHASMYGIYFDEDVLAEGYGPPRRCLPDPDWTTWMGRHEVEVEEAARRAPFPVLLPSAPPTDSAPTILYDWGTMGGYCPEAVILGYELSDNRICEVVQAAWPHIYLRSIDWQLVYQGGHVLFRAKTEFAEPAIKVLLQRGEAIIWPRSHLSHDELIDIALSLEPFRSSTDNEGSGQAD
jgi:hypothetical protein